MADHSIPNSTEIVADVLDTHGETFHHIFTHYFNVDPEAYSLILQFGEVCATAGVKAGLDLAQEVMGGA